MYGRKSANSTENPLRGERCKPARKPSTIQRATISMRPRAARLAGSKRSARAARVVSTCGAKVGEARRAAVLPLLALVSACATAGGASPVGPPGEREAVAERGPRAHIWAADEFSTGN